MAPVHLSTRTLCHPRDGAGTALLLMLLMLVVVGISPAEATGPRIASQLDTCSLHGVPSATLYVKNGVCTYSVRSIPDGRLDNGQCYTTRGDQVYQFQFPCTKKSRTSNLQGPALGLWVSVDARQKLGRRMQKKAFEDRCSLITKYPTLTYHMHPDVVYGWNAHNLKCQITGYNKNALRGEPVEYGLFLTPSVPAVAEASIPTLLSGPSDATSCYLTIRAGISGVYFQSKATVNCTIRANPEKLYSKSCCA